MVVAGQAVNNKDDVLKGKGMELQCVCVCVCVCVYLRSRHSLSFILSNKYSHGCLSCCIPGLLLSRGAHGGEGSENKHLPNNEKNKTTTTTLFFKYIRLH